MTTTKASGVRVAALLERMQTKEGRAAVERVADRVVPQLRKDKNDLDPFYSGPLPDDAFERGIVQGIHGRAIRMSDARQNMSAAIADLFIQAAGDDGVLTAQEAAAALGPQGAAFFQTLSRIQDPNAAEPIADRLALDHLAPAMKKKLLANEPSISPPMAALDFMMREVAQKDEFQDFQFLGLQHLFASSTTMFDALHQLGIDHDVMRFIGKIYSTNYRAADQLEAQGSHVDAVSRRITNSIPFEQAMGQSIEWQIRQMIDKLPHPNSPQWHEDQKNGVKPQCLLIDDGGEAVKILCEKYPDYAPYFCCVEQTRRGARVIHELEAQGKLRCAVANVAESWAKLEWESPMIGHSVMLEVTRKLDKLQSYGVDTGKEAVVVGYGSVGKAVAQSLMERGYTVHVYDKDPARLKDLPQGMVGHNDMGDALPHANVLVSCVGSQTLHTADHELLPEGAILVNAASSDDELGPEELLPFRKRNSTRDDTGFIWSTYQGKAVCVGLGEAEAHSDSVVKLPSGKELYVVSNGFVVNMTGERDPIPPRFIQLTRTLLLLGALTARRAAEEGKTGFIDIPKEWQEALVNFIQRELKKSGESLKSPAWEKKEPPPPPAPRTPPHSILEELAQEQQVAALTAPLQEAPRGPITKVYGYEIGDVGRNLTAKTIDDVIGNGDGKLSVDEAAQHKAGLALSRHYGVTIRLAARQGQLAHPAETVKSSTYRETGTIDTTVSPQNDKERFEVVFASLVAMVVKTKIQQREGRAPGYDEIAAEASKIFKSSSVDTGVWLKMLAASESAEDRALADALSKRA